MRIKARITTPAVIEINRMPMILRFKFTNGGTRIMQEIKQAQEACL